MTDVSANIFIMGGVVGCVSVFCLLLEREVMSTFILSMLISIGLMVLIAIIFTVICMMVEYALSVYDRIAEGKTWRKNRN